MQHPSRITIDPNAEHEDRFHRFSLISWWDQNRLKNAKILVIGAGALGNEILKNLALLGVGHILVADMDRVENSNLSRSVLYRARDNGELKATAAAKAAKDLYPDLNIHAFNGNVVYDLGLGAFRWADLVLAGLDNREARLAINRACWKLNKPWIDGAIETIQGTARVFVPDGQAQAAPCYECTMSETDWRLLNLRRSCNLLTRQEMQAGRTPTTPTISSIIAGVQVQEALKLLHNLESFPGKAFVFQGLSADAYLTEFQRNPNCFSHDPIDQIIPLQASADTLTPRQLLQQARSLLGPTAELEMGKDILEKLVCPHCKSEEPLFASLGKVPVEKAWCPHCKSKGHDSRRDVVTFHKIRGQEPFLDQPLSTIGIPPYDIILSRNANQVLGFELSADAPKVLGPLYQPPTNEEALDFS